jgi:hypothetical protein
MSIVFKLRVGMLDTKRFLWVVFSVNGFIDIINK